MPGGFLPHKIRAATFESLMEVQECPTSGQGGSVRPPAYDAASRPPNPLRAPRSRNRGETIDPNRKKKTKRGLARRGGQR
eukprot:4537573-Pyramimonas_sp.AAC.1